MPLDLTLCRTTWRWQLRDDHRVDQWLGERRWLGYGGVLVVQAANDGDVSLTALRRNVYSADGRMSEVRIVALEADEPVPAAVAAWMSVRPRRDRELVTELAAGAALRPVVFVVDTRGFGNATRRADEAATLVDLALKVGLERAPTFLIVHERGHAPLRGTLELDRGWPIGLARSLVDSAEPSLWDQYVHLRLAWETGGIVEDAQKCARLAGDSIRLQDDDDLERHLNAYATSRFELMSEEERSAWIEYASTPRNRGRLPTIDGRVERVERITPFPWLARALLLHIKGLPTLRALRAELNCWPLVEQVLNACFSVEAALRGRLPEHLGNPPDEPYLQKAYARFAARGALGPSLESDLYPGPHPCRPADVWDFASVGHILRHLPTVEPAEDRLTQRVRILRNAAAHCHYMGWRALCEARQVRRLLA